VFEDDLEEGQGPDLKERQPQGQQETTNQLVVLQNPPEQAFYILRVATLSLPQVFPIKHALPDAIPH